MKNTLCFLLLSLLVLSACKSHAAPPYWRDGAQIPRDVRSDLIAPTVRIVTPTNSAVSGKTLEIKVTATDNIAVNRMELFIGYKLVATSNTNSVSYTWNIGAVKVVNDAIYANAYDSSNNKGTSQIMVIRKGK